MGHVTEPFGARNWLRFGHNDVSIIRTIILLLPLTGLFIALRTGGMTSYNLWGGEAFTILGVRQSWGEMFDYVITDVVHPPLFYVLLKMWIALGGETLFWIKLLPVLITIASLLPFLLLCHELQMGRGAIALALLLVASNGYLVHYAQSVRMYPLFMFLALCSYWLFIRNLRAADSGRQGLVVLTVINLLMIYSHYYGWLVIVVEWLYVLIRKRHAIGRFTVSVLLLALCFAPWLYLVVQAAILKGGLSPNLDWIPHPGLSDVSDLYMTFNGPLRFPGSYLIGLLLFGAPIGAWALRWLTGQARGQDALVFEWLALLAFVPPGLLFVVSRVADHGFWIDRYFIFITVPYLMLVASAVDRLHPKRLRFVLVSLLALWSLAAGAIDVTTHRVAWESPQLGSRLPWSEIALILTQETTTSDEVVIYTIPVRSKGMLTGDWAIKTSLAFHLAGYEDRQFSFKYVRNSDLLLSTAGERHFWVASFQLPEMAREPVAARLERAGYEVGRGVRVGQPHRHFVLFPVWRPLEQ